MLNKRADVGLGVIVVILIIAIFLGWLVREGWKECRVDSDCGEGKYCTSQFECKQIPVIEKTSPSNQFTAGNSTAWIIGICLIIAAIIMKWDSIAGAFRKKAAKKMVREEYVDLSKKYHSEDKGMFQEELEKE